MVMYKERVINYRGDDVGCFVRLWARGRVERARERRRWRDCMV